MTFKNLTYLIFSLKFQQNDQYYIRRCMVLWCQCVDLIHIHFGLKIEYLSIRRFKISSIFILLNSKRVKFNRLTYMRFIKAKKKLHFIEKVLMPIFSNSDIIFKILNISNHTMSRCVGNIS